MPLFCVLSPLRAFVKRNRVNALEREIEALRGLENAFSQVWSNREQILALFRGLEVALSDYDKRSNSMKNEAMFYDKRSIDYEKQSNRL